MTNKYLKKIAGAEIDVAGSGWENKHKAEKASTTAPVKTELTEKTAGLASSTAGFWKELRPVEKAKLGMSAAGLGLGTAGFIQGTQKGKGDRHRENLEAQSLATLKRIHESLTSKDKPE